MLFEVEDSVLKKNGNPILKDMAMKVIPAERSLRVKVTHLGDTETPIDMSLWLVSVGLTSITLNGVESTTQTKFRLTIGVSISLKGLRFSVKGHSERNGKRRVIESTISSPIDFLTLIKSAIEADE